MDMNIFRGLTTLITMILFIVLCFWIYSKKNKATYDKASKMALENDNSKTEEEAKAKDKPQQEVSIHE